MAAQKIDKDYLFKTAIRILAEEMHFNSEQINKAMDILTSTFSNVDFISSECMLSVDRCQNQIILKNFIGCKKMAGIKDSSIEQYALSISGLLRYINKNLVDIDTNDIRRFILNYEKTVSKVTANNCRRNLNVFFQFMEDEGYIIKNPVKRIPKIKEEKRFKRFYTDLEIESMRDACENKREIALIDLLISTGLRVSEVSNILLSEVNFDDKTIIVHGKGDKDRIVPFSVRCKKHLLEYMLERGRVSNYLFCSSKKPYGRLSTGTINQIVQAVGARVGLPKITVHCFRRWFASDLNKKSVDPVIIQGILGHSSFETTQKHYLSKSYDKITYIHNVYAG
ncbi:MAG: tyrosine-type recombinase/integrase [Lachnospiraceae bacterium]|nr:tyrosine-type recombinase/integrase [Lachnospiraceae bacterium]